MIQHCRVVPDFDSGSGESEIQPSPAPAKFLAGFGGCRCSWMQYAELIEDKTNAADLSSGVFTI